MVTGTVKYESDRLYKNNTRRKVVFNTPQGEATIWGDATDPVLSTIRKGQHAQLLVDQKGNWSIASVGSNGHTHPQQVNPTPQYQQAQPEYHVPATGYPNLGPAVAPAMTAGGTTPATGYQAPGQESDDDRVKRYTELYLNIWSELTTNEKFPFAASDEIIQKSVATIFIQVARG